VVKDLFFLEVKQILWYPQAVTHQKISKGLALFIRFPFVVRFQGCLFPEFLAQAAWNGGPKRFCTVLVNKLFGMKIKV
jgi:hypothetical protein